MLQNLSSAAVMIGILRIKIFIFRVMRLATLILQEIYLYQGL